MNYQHGSVENLIRKIDIKNPEESLQIEDDILKPRQLRISRRTLLKINKCEDMLNYKTHEKFLSALMDALLQAHKN